MRKKPRDRRRVVDDLPVADINTTPLIDVMLVLLVMIIITIPVQLHAVKLNLPVGNLPASDHKPEVVQIDVAATGALGWNGVPLAGRAREVRRVRRRDGRREPGRADARGRHRQRTVHDAVNETTK